MVIRYLMGILNMNNEENTGLTGVNVVFGGAIYQTVNEFAKSMGFEEDSGVVQRQVENKHYPSVRIGKRRLVNRLHIFLAEVEAYNKAKAEEQEQEATKNTKH